MQKPEFKNTIPFIITPKKINYLDVYLTKQVQDFYDIYYKILMKELKDLKNGFNVGPVKVPAICSVRHF